MIFEETPLLVFVLPTRMGCLK